MKLVKRSVFMAVGLLTLVLAPSAKAQYPYVVPTPPVVVSPPVLSFGAVYAPRFVAPYPVVRVAPPVYVRPLPPVYAPRVYTYGPGWGYGPRYYGGYRYYR